MVKGGRPSVADFIHGSDGLGNILLPPPKAKKIDKSASEFLVDKVSEFPGEVSVLALGPLTNLALVSPYIMHCFSCMYLLYGPQLKSLPKFKFAYAYG